MFDFFKKKKEVMSHITALRIVARRKYSQNDLKVAGVKSFIFGLMYEPAGDHTEIVTNIAAQDGVDAMTLNLQVSKILANKLMEE